MLAFLAGNLAPVLADPDDGSAAPLPTVATSASSNFSQVTCTSTDPVACVDTLQMADDTRDQLRSLLQLGKDWRFPIHIHIVTPDDPLSAKINREAAAVFADKGGMHIEVVVPIDDPNRNAFVQYQFVVDLLWEKFFAGTQQFDANTKLDVVPVWLAVGLREWLNDDPEHDRENIVRRAVQTKHSPTLAEVTSWKELSKDHLMGLWQSAFSYYLFDSLVKTPARRADFQQWLNSCADARPQSAELLFPTEGNWQAELADSTERSHAIVYTWEETLAEMTAADTITIAGAKPTDAPQTSTIETVTSLPRTPQFLDSLQKKIYELTALELRAHVSWRPIIALYRFALTDLATSANPEKAKGMIAQAHALRAAEIDNRGKLLDYMNWFEVTKDYVGNTTRFSVYFSAAQEIEQAEADPAHSNPIRADLQHAESQL